MSPRIVLLRLLVLVAFFLAVGSASASTHYIATNGSDSNNGTSTSAPWAHLPGMATCTSNCGSYTPVAGDTFVMRGCDVWGNANFPINWNWSGTSSNPITIGGADQTWYNTTNCPNSWNRPVFNAGGTPISGNNTFVNQGGTWQTWTWIECTGLQWTNNNAVNCFNGSSNGTVIDHWYVHGWHHSGSASQDKFVAFQGGWPVGNNTMIQYTVFDGSDSSGGGDSGSFFYEWGSAKWNVVHGAPNAFYFAYANHASPTEIAYNLAYNIGSVSGFDPGVHENVFEAGGCGTDGNCTFYIHDNVWGPQGQGETMMVANSGETDYIWNNVSYDSWEFRMPQNGTPGVAMYIWNNSINVNHFGLTCFVSGGNSPWQTLVIRNNHCIDDAGFGPFSSSQATTLVQDHNVTNTVAAAASQGYVTSGNYVYSPQSANCNGIPANCPIGAGVNATGSAYWPSGFSTNDTSYACTQATIGGVVQASCTARTPAPRPASGSWDAGAYQYSSTSNPNPPTGLSAVVN